MKKLITLLVIFQSLISLSIQAQLVPPQREDNTIKKEKWHWDNALK